MSNYHTQEKGPFTIKTGEALVANNLVTISSTGLVMKCGAAAQPAGWVDQAWASGAYATVLPISGIVQGVALGGITAGDLLKAGAAGVVVPEATVTTLTANTIGIALETVLTTEDIHFLPYR